MKKKLLLPSLVLAFSQVFNTAAASNNISDYVGESTLVGTPSVNIIPGAFIIPTGIVKPIRYDFGEDNLLIKARPVTSDSCNLKIKHSLDSSRGVENFYSDISKKTFLGYSNFKTGKKYLFSNTFNGSSFVIEVGKMVHQYVDISCVVKVTKVKLKPKPKAAPKPSNTEVNRENLSKIKITRYEDEVEYVQRGRTHKIHVTPGTEKYKEVSISYSREVSFSEGQNAGLNTNLSVPFLSAGASAGISSDYQTKLEEEITETIGVTFNGSVCKDWAYSVHSKRRTGYVSAPELGMNNEIAFTFTEGMEIKEVNLCEAKAEIDSKSESDNSKQNEKKSLSLVPKI